MDTDLILSLVKARLGITSAVRDQYLTAIINGIITELTDEKGIVLNQDNANHLMFCVDYSTWRYMSRDSEGALPRHLQFRLHNLIIHNGGAEDGNV
ncbi:hypothetical protein DFO70_11141 [Cytobacillus firmus]|uniref:Phage protein n=2 Tax=Cytobacillus TaxID=2675230 RepID=A0A366JNB6_CYTFI|nr:MULTISPECIES: hypothetical protein [Cytobacillus]RBP89394.1 hypothetical protein DFO70_11141 [Cytobacillus firmus]TDX47379.1 hypothetical protein DFO72_101476 [Cytobacillus oceanisediminis]